jgi:uncharacterized protein YcgL (UPF0745 family)
MYLYVTEEDGFDRIPPELLEQFGAPEFVIQLELHGDRKLAREDVTAVMNNLADHGFHLQLPPKLEPYLYEGE